MGLLETRAASTRATAMPVTCAGAGPRTHRPVHSGAVAGPPHDGAWGGTEGSGAGVPVEQVTNRSVGEARGGFDQGGSAGNIVASFTSTGMCGFALTVVKVRRAEL